MARRQQALDDVAEEIRATSDVELRVVTVDLTEANAVASLKEVTSDVDVGLVFDAEGGDQNYEPSSHSLWKSPWPS